MPKGRNQLVLDLCDHSSLKRCPYCSASYSFFTLSGDIDPFQKFQWMFPNHKSGKGTIPSIRGLTCLSGTFLCLTICLKCYRLIDFDPLQLINLP